jgi:hypothetical protein
MQRRMNWLHLRAQLKPIIVAAEERASMRQIQNAIGIAPSTIVRWKKELDKPIALNSVVKVLEYLGESPAEFFARVEGRDLGRQSGDQNLPSISDGGSDVPTARERDRIRELEAEVEGFKAKWRDVQDVARSLFAITAVDQGGAAAGRKARRSRTAGKVG